MRRLTFFKTLTLAVMLLVGSEIVWAQATLPITATFSTVTTTGAGTMPIGFTHSGLAGYAGSLKFDDANDYLILNFSGTPGTLTFDLGVNNTYPGSIPASATFTVQESDNGSNYTNVTTYTGVAGGTKSISTLKSTSSYVKWIYTTKPSGTNLSLKNVSLTAGITCTASNLAFSQPTVNKIVTDAAFTQVATSANATTAITYASTVEGVATVNETTGEVTIVGAGSTTITATQAAGTHNAVSYCASTATYTLNVASTAPTITVTEVTVPAFSAYATETDSEIIQVSGANLTESIGLQLTGDNANLFSLSTNSVTSTANNVAVTVYYNPTTPGSHTATLTLTSAGATSVVRTLNGSSTWKPLTTPVATEASNITNAGFTANWDAVVGATEYEVNVTKETVTPVFATDLFISEYVEGSGSYEKYIEIFNGTGSDVELSNYKLQLFSNGSSTVSNESTLSGTLVNGTTIVYKYSNLSAYSGNATSLTSVINFNGDDAIALYKILPSGFVDIFGRIGDRPSNAWTSSSITTADKTLVRRPTVTSGVTTNPTGTGVSAFTTLGTEWTQYNQDVVSNLGSHTMNATSVSSTPLAESPYTVMGDNSKTITGLDAGATYKYTVTAKNANVTSSVSNTISVVTSTGTGIEQTKNNTNIYSVNGKLIVESQVATTVNIYNAVGQLIDTKQAHAGKNTFTVASKGIVIVKSNNKTAKVIL